MNIKNSVIKLNNVTKRFPVGGDYFIALKNIDLTWLFMGYMVGNAPKCHKIGL